MGKPLMRRFHEVLGRATYSLIAWLAATIVAVQMEAGTEAFKTNPGHSYTFFLACFPLYCVVMFGCYTLITIGYHMVVLCKYSFDITHPFVADCKDAQDELFVEIKNARKFLESKGMNLSSST